jgi:hypothetical protein
MTWVTIPDLGKGLNEDSSPEELGPGVSTSSTNMRFANGYASRFKGMQTVYTTPLVAPYHITHFTVNASRYVVYAGLQKTYVDDGATQTDITNANNTGAINDRYCGFSFNGVYVQNNGVNIPQYWGGNVANNLANLTAWPAGYTAGFMRPFKNYLIAGDITKTGTRYRQLVLTSDLCDPGAIPTTWNASDATADATETPLAETDGTLIDGAALGDIFVLYKDDALHFAQTINSADIFRFGRLPGETGLMARGCVVATPKGHVFLTPGLDLVIHNGQGLQSLITGRMRTWLSANMNTSRAVRSFLVMSAATAEVLACFPSGASDTCDKALVWNWRDNTVYTRELSNVTYGSEGLVNLAGTDTWAAATGTWATDTDAWNDGASLDGISRLIFTRTTPALAMFDSTELDYGSDFTGSFERTGMHFDAPEVVKLCRGVRARIDASQGAEISIQIGSQMVPDGAVTWSSAVTYTVGTDIEVHSFASGRFLAIRHSATVPYRIRGLQMDIVPQGGY